MTYSEVAVAHYNTVNTNFDKPRAYSTSTGVDWTERLTAKSSSTSTTYGSHKVDDMDKNDQHDQGTSRMLDDHGRLQRLGRGSIDAVAVRQVMEDDSSRRSSYSTAAEQYRRASFLHSRSPSIGEHGLTQGLPMPTSQPPRSTPRQAPYGYYPEDSSQYNSQNLQSTTLGYGSEYSSSDQIPRQNSYSTYSPSMVYNVGQTSQTSAYDQSYAPRPPAAAAIEVLSSQFGGVPQYYPGETTPQSTSSASHQQSSSQFQGLQYQSSAGRQGTLSSQYVTGIPSMSTPSVPEETYDNQLLYGLSSSGTNANTNQTQAMEDAYQTYQTALKTTFQNMLQGRLGEAGDSLLNISDWLLSNVVELGLVRDEQELHNDRAVLWTEFNMCWLSTLHRQKELMANYLTAGSAAQPLQDYIKEEQLEKMGRELIRLCDNMERHGLVDYEMGVWEEMILEVLQECLDQLETQSISEQRSLEGAGSSKQSGDWKPEPVSQ